MRYRWTPGASPRARACSFGLLPEPRGSHADVWSEGLQEEGARIWSHLEPGRVSAGRTSVWNFVEIPSVLIYHPLGTPRSECRLVRKLVSGKSRGTQLCLIIRTYDQSVWPIFCAKLYISYLGHLGSISHQKQNKNAIKLNVKAQTYHTSIKICTVILK